MARLDSATLSALLRAQLISRSAGSAGQQAGAGSVEHLGRKNQSQTTSESEGKNLLLLAGEVALERKWTLRLQSISDDDPQRSRKAFRLFREAVLEKALGSLIPSEIMFAQVVEQVMQQIEEDPDLSELGLIAGDELLSRALALRV